MDIRLRERREQLGLTQQELAKLVGKSFRTIQAWERGESFPNAKYVSVLCNIFNVDANDLLGWNEAHKDDLDDPEATELLRLFGTCTDEWKRYVINCARLAAIQSREGAECPFWDEGDEREEADA